jgi:hypothetical protein
MGLIFELPLNAAFNIDIAQVQVEPGPVDTPFERRPIGTELALCQRYFQKSYNIDVAPGTTGGIGMNGMVSHAASSYTGFGIVNFPVSMRIAPTVTGYNPDTGTTTTFVRNFSASTNLNGSISNIGQAGFPSNIDNGPVTISQSVGYHWTASAEL